MTHQTSCNCGKTVLSDTAQASLETPPLLQCIKNTIGNLKRSQDSIGLSKSETRNQSNLNFSFIIPSFNWVYNIEKFYSD